MNRIWISFFVIFGLLTNYWVVSVQAEMGVGNQQGIAHKGMAITGKLSSKKVQGIDFKGTEEGEEIHSISTDFQEDEINYLVGLYNGLEAVEGQPVLPLSNQIMNIEMEDGNEIVLEGDVFSNAKPVFAIHQGEKKVYAASEELKKYVRTLLLAATPDMNITNITVFNGTNSEDFAPMAVENEKLVVEVTEAIKPVIISPNTSSLVSTQIFTNEQQNPAFKYVKVDLKEPLMLKQAQASSIVVILNGTYKNQALFITNGQVVFSQKLPGSLNL